MLAIRRHCRCRGQVVEKLGLEEAGPPLGLDLARGYASFTTDIAESDTIVLYTDGISEEARLRYAIYIYGRVSDWSAGWQPDRTTPSRWVSICSPTSSGSPMADRRATISAS